MEKIIFDTDIGGDCDDAGALAVIHDAEILLDKAMCGKIFE
jgi:hypothetical protein